MHDSFVRATGEGLRAVAAITTAAVEEARWRHLCQPVASAALGRTMTAALLLAALLEIEETVTVRIAGNGPLGGIIADANAHGDIRGYVNNPAVRGTIKDGKLDVGTAVGSGYMYVSRFTPHGEPFTGSAPLLNGEIAADVTNYLLVSEQIPSTVGLGVLVQPDLHVAAAGGFVVQAMPNATPALLTQIEHNVSCLPPVSSLIQQGWNGEDILRQMFHPLPLTVYETRPVAFRCRCSHARVAEVLVSLGQHELADMAAEGQAKVKCEFCGAQYVFDRDELLALRAEAQQK